MGLSVSTVVFQAEVSKLVNDLEYARAYLDDLLCLTCGSYEDHIEKLITLLKRLETAGLKINKEKSIFCASQIEYLGLLIT